MVKPAHPKISNQHLVHERLARGWSQADVAKRLKTTVWVVSRWERGKAFPGPYHRQNLCELYEKTPAELGLIPTNASDGSEQCPAQPFPEQETAQERPEASELPSTEANDTSEQQTSQSFHRQEGPQEASDATELHTAQEEGNTIALQTERGTSQETQQSLSEKSPVWDVPYQRNPFFTAREDVLEYLHGTFMKTEEGVSVQPLAICGLGGMGKTQIAIEYVWRYRSNYEAVLWIKADSHEALTTGFVHIAEMLNLPEKASPDQGYIVDAVMRQLQEQTKWLLILDDVETPELLQAFIPPESKSHILLTSRAQAMGIIAQTIELNGMEPGEGALLLLRRAKKIALTSPLDQASEDDQKTAREISQALGGLPLALDQAGAYIEETACGLSRYLELYHRQQGELLKVRSTLSVPYPKSVATTWALSFKRVKQANRAAIELLYFFAFLDPDMIREEIITHGAPHLGLHLLFVAVDSLKLEAAISQLRKFSLVRRDPENKALSIHRLVQVIVKNGMSKRMQRRWAGRAVKAVNKAFLYGVYLPEARACATLIKQWGLASKEAANLLFQAGSHAQSRLLYRLAGSLFQQALPICERVYRARSMQVVNCLTHIALVYQAQEKFEEAEPFYQRALEIRTKLRGSANPTVAECLANLAGIYGLQGKYEQAEAIYQELLEQEHPDMAVLEDKAALYYEQGRYAEAEALIQQELVILQQMLGPESLKVAAITEYLADIYMCQGKYVEAEPLLQQTLVLLKQWLGEEAEESSLIAQNLLPLAEIHVFKGEYGEAESLYKRALAIMEKTEEREQVLLVRILVSYASFLKAMKREEEAESLFARARIISEEISSESEFWKQLLRRSNE